MSSSKPAVVTQAEDLTSLGKQIHVKSLNNGLTVLVFERNATPLFSVFTHVDIGSNGNCLRAGVYPHARNVGCSRPLDHSSGHKNMRSGEQI